MQKFLIKLHTYKVFNQGRIKWCKAQLQYWDKGYPVRNDKQAVIRQRNLKMYKRLMFNFKLQAILLFPF